jgi:hypothetical protein
MSKGLNAPPGTAGMRALSVTLLSSLLVIGFYYLVLNEPRQKR